jgi:hypothetical protein
MSDPESEARRRQCDIDAARAKTALLNRIRDNELRKEADKRAKEEKELQEEIEKLR